MFTNFPIKFTFLNFLVPRFQISRHSFLVLFFLFLSISLFCVLCLAVVTFFVNSVVRAACIYYRFICISVAQNKDNPL